MASKAVELVSALKFHSVWFEEVSDADIGCLSKPKLSTVPSHDPTLTLLAEAQLWRDVIVTSIVGGPACECDMRAKSVGQFIRIKSRPRSAYWLASRLLNPIRRQQRSNQRWRPSRISSPPTAAPQPNRNANLYMYTHSKSTFSAASYAAFRPTYPPSLYNTLLAYHRGPKRLCLDLGCGTGIVTREMSKRFERVIGSDPSRGMIKQAREQTAGKEFENVEFREGSAESSPFVGDGEVDCVVAGQAAHWFNYAKLWPELERILRPGGTVAFWGYKDPVLVDFPNATRILNKYTYGPDPETLGPYWTMPGRSYVQDKLRVIKPPPTHFEDVERIEYEPVCNGARSGEGTIFMEKSLSVAETKAYYRTWSSFHGWAEAHPGRVARGSGGEGDLMDGIFDEMAEGDGVLGDEGMVVRMEWGSGVVLGRRR